MKIVCIVVVGCLLWLTHLSLFVFKQSVSLQDAQEQLAALRVRLGDREGPAITSVTADDSDSVMPKPRVKRNRGAAFA